MLRVICLVGPPGSGKTTLATDLAAIHELPYRSIDDFSGSFETRWRALDRWVRTHGETVLVEANVIGPPFRPTLDKTPHCIIRLRPPRHVRMQHLRARGETPAKARALLQERPVGYDVDVTVRSAEQAAAEISEAVQSEGRRMFSAPHVKLGAQGGGSTFSTDLSQTRAPVRFLSPRPKNWKKTTTQRGYGTHHQALRKRLEPVVAAGKARCARCGKPIAPGERWDLGHDDEDRTKYSGPEHLKCNRATASRRKARERPTSRKW